jgi:hypothetical protein
MMQRLYELELELERRRKAVDRPPREPYADPSEASALDRQPGWWSVLLGILRYRRARLAAR